MAKRAILRLGPETKRRGSIIPQGVIDGAFRWVDRNDLDQGRPRDPTDIRVPIEVESPRRFRADKVRLPAGLGEDQRLRGRIDLECGQERTEVSLSRLELQMN